MITICFINDKGDAVVRSLPAVPSVGDTIPLWTNKVDKVERVVWFPLDFMPELKDKLDGITPDVVVLCEW